MSYRIDVNFDYRQFCVRQLTLSIIVGDSTTDYPSGRLDLNKLFVGMQLLCSFSNSKFVWKVNNMHRVMIQINDKNFENDPKILWSNQIWRVDRPDRLMTTKRKQFRDQNNSFRFFIRRRFVALTGIGHRSSQRVLILRIEVVVKGKTVSTNKPSFFRITEFWAQFRIWRHQDVVQTVTIMLSEKLSKACLIHDNRSMIMRCTWKFSLNGGLCSQRARKTFLTKGKAARNLFIYLFYFLWISSVSTIFIAEM